MMSGGITDTHTYRIKRDGTSASELAEDKKTEMNHDHKSNQARIQCDCCFLKTEEGLPMITVLAIDTVHKQMVANFCEKKGNRNPLASRSLAAFACWFFL